MKVNKKVYETPEMEVIEIAVEQAVFQSSTGGQDMDVDDSWGWGN